MNAPPPALLDAQEALRHSEERYRLLVEGVKDYAIFLLDPTGRIMTWNAGAERIKGYTAQEIIGRHFSVFYTPEDVRNGVPEEALRIAAAQGRCEMESWRVRKDGSRFFADVVINVLRDEAGQLLGFSKVTRDLTERQRVAALAEANRRKDEFLAMLAHELRNPLAPLLTSIQVLRQGRASARDREESLDRMERQVRRLTGLLEDLLDVSRITRGKVVLHLQRLDFARLVRTTAEDRRGLLEQAGLTLTVQTPETPVWVRGDPTRLAQVLDNLLDNAGKFTDRGWRLEVRLTVDENKRQAIAVVCDTGVGIEAELMPRLFDVFAQADRSLERTRGGLGLGLSVVKGLAEMHGGEVRAASAGPGRGAEFTVRLPVEEEPPALAEPARPPQPNGELLRVVVIEDNHDAADSLRAVLELLGNEVRVAYTGLEGVKAVTDWRPDAVISDIGLPGLDGYGVARQLRRDPAAARTLLIGLSGYGSEDDVARAREAGFDHYLVKPASTESLQRLLTNGRKAS